MGKAVVQKGHTGFTLIELMVVVSLIAIFSALAIGVLKASGRVRLGNAAFDVTAALSMAQSRARSLGRYEYVVFWENSTTKAFGEQTLELPLSVASGYDWSSYDSTNPATLTDSQGTAATQVDELPLSASGGIAPYPLADTTAPPVPFSAVARTGTSGSDLSAACGFCTAGSLGTVGAVEFAPDGRVRMATDTNALFGGAIAFAVSHAGETAQPKVIAITVPTGLAKVFQQ